MKLSLLLLHLLAFQAYAKVIPPLDGKGVSNDVGPGLSHLPSQSRHQKRTTRPLCAAPVYNPGQKRDIALDTEYLNATLDKRTMTVPQGTTARLMDKFMSQELSAGLRRYPIIWPRETRGQEIATCTAKFHAFKDEAFSVGTGELCGCTTMVIVSRLGVFTGHYWEDLAFAPEPEMIQKFGGSEDRVFSAAVITPLTKGIKGQQDALNKNSIDDPTIRAYLMIPTETHDNVPDGYRQKWDRLKTAVGRIIPRLADNNLWTEIKYDALDLDTPGNQALLDDTARGTLLFKYDPDENGKKRAALWVEQQSKPYHNDIW